MTDAQIQFEKFIKWLEFKASEFKYYNLIDEYNTVRILIADLHLIKIKYGEFRQRAIDLWGCDKIDKQRI